jgi:hypothetical protein
VSGIVPVPEDDDVTSGIREPDCMCADCVKRDAAAAKGFPPEYIYTVWAADGTTGGVMKVYQNTNRASAEDFAKRIVGSKSGAIMTRDEIILDLRRMPPGV